MSSREAECCATWLTCSSGNSKWMCWRTPRQGQAMYIWVCLLLPWWGCWLWETFQSRVAHGSAAHEDWNHPEYLKLFKLWSLLLKSIYEHWSIACTNLHISNIDCICIKEPPWGRSSDRDPQMCILKFYSQAQVCVHPCNGEPDELAWLPLWPYATVWQKDIMFQFSVWTTTWTLKLTYFYVKFFYSLIFNKL